MENFKKNTQVLGKLQSILLERLNAEMKKDVIGHDIDSDLSYLLMNECQSMREYRLATKVFKILFGFDYSELSHHMDLEKQELDKEVEELNHYVNSLKEKLIEDVQIGKPIIIGTPGPSSTHLLEEMFKHMHNVTVVGKRGKSHSMEKIEREFIGEKENLNGDEYFKKHFIAAYPLTPEDCEKIIGDTKRFASLSEKELTKLMDKDFEEHKKLIRKPVVIDKLVLEERLAKLKKEEQRLKKLPKSQRGDLKEVQDKINRIKSWLN